MPIKARNIDGEYEKVADIVLSDGTYINRVYDKDGDLVYTSFSEIIGGLPITFKTSGKYLTDYRIYGNTFQSSEPSPENPVEVVGCGVYDETLNGYKIPVTVTKGSETITTPVYIGSEPLHKIGDYADYVDFKRGVVVRRIKKLVLTGEENITLFEISGDNLFRISLFFNRIAEQFTGLCSHYRSTGRRSDGTISGAASTSHTVDIVDNNYSSVSDFKSYLAAQYEAGTPVTVWYVLAEPEEEQLDLSAIQTLKGTNILTADTEVQPSEMYIKYRR